MIKAGPILPLHFIQVDEDLLQPLDDPRVQRLLLRHGAGVADGEPDDDEVVAAGDAEIVSPIAEVGLVGLGWSRSDALARRRSRAWPDRAPGLR